MSESTPNLETHAAEDAVVAATLAASAPSPSPSPSEDQLPTSRLQSIAPPSLPLPPLVPPLGPAHKTQPLRALSPRAAEARLTSEAKRMQWATLLSSLKKRTSALLPQRSRYEWTQRRIAGACALAGLAMIFGSFVAGWAGVASARPNPEVHVAFAVSLVAARAAMSIAAACVGWAFLRMAERLGFPAPAPAPEWREERGSEDSRQQS